ncbi:MAG TPA: hypothetical protein PK616_07570, partial [Fibrobacteraceae bacterium]|nr:hypothetical protein [Fibrobacteraceae bacterium]
MLNNIIKPQKLEEKISDVDKMMKELENLDQALTDKLNKIEELKSRDIEIEAELRPLEASVAKKELIL